MTWCYFTSSAENYIQFSTRKLWWWWWWWWCPWFNNKFVLKITWWFHGCFRNKLCFWRMLFFLWFTGHLMGTSGEKQCFCRSILWFQEKHVFWLWLFDHVFTDLIKTDLPHSQDFVRMSRGLEETKRIFWRYFEFPPRACILFMGFFVDLLIFRGFVQEAKDISRIMRLVVPMWVVALSV